MYANKSGKNEKIIKLYNSLSQVQLFFSVQLKPGGHSLSIRGYSDRQGFLRLKVIYQRVGNSRVEVFFVCNHVIGRSCWGSIQQNFFWKNLHENRVLFPEESNALVLDHQHGRRDVTCKAGIWKGEEIFYSSIWGCPIGFFRVNTSQVWA